MREHEARGMREHEARDPIKQGKKEAEGGNGEEQREAQERSGNRHRRGEEIGTRQKRDARATVRSLGLWCG
jgi:hypothetical protein